MRKIITLLALAFIAINGFTQEIISPETLTAAKAKIEKGKSLYYQSAYSEILTLTQEAFDVFSKDSVNCDSMIAEVYYLEGRVWLRKGNFDKAGQLINKSLDIRKQAFGTYSLPVVKSLNLLASIHAYNNNHRKAETIYFNSWDILDSIANENNEAWVHLFINLGAVYLNLSDYENSILFYEKAIQANSNTFSKPNINLCLTYINLGVTYEEMGDYNAAISTFKKSKEVYNKITDEVSSYYLAHIHHCIGYSSSNAKKYNEGIENMNAAIQVLDDSNEDRFWLRAMLNENLGNAYLHLNDLDKATLHLKKSHYYLNLLPNQSVDNFFSSKITLARVQAAKNEFVQALSLIEETAKQINFQESNYNFNQLAIRPEIIVIGLNAKTKILLDKFSYKKEVEDLHIAHATSNTMISILDTIKLNLKESGSKKFLVNQLYSVYENAIETNYQLWQATKDTVYINTAFQLSEKSKANQLMDAVLKSKAEKFAGIPATLLDEEESLQVTITDKKKEKHKLESAGKSAESKELASINKELFDLKISHKNLIERFETDYPRYFNLKYATSANNIASTQSSSLQNDQSLIEYFVGEEAVYVFVINKKGIHFFKQQVDDLKDVVNTFYNSMRNFDMRIIDRDSIDAAFTDNAHQLYQLLIEPIEKQLQQNIIVIPDGVLNYIPFAALIKTQPTDPGAFRTHDYLLHHYNISYNYSSSLIKEMSAVRTQKTTNDLLAIAPSFLSPYRGVKLRGDHLTPLEHNESEVDQILKLCKGTSLKSSEASKENFMKLASNYKAIHFATHGVANEESGAYSYIAFTLDENTRGDENILFGVDIYNLNLNADMVVLSACETAVGELNRGEGVVSTARAFAFAGAKNLVTTLWKVSDSQASELMNGFYGNLRNDTPKDRALHETTQDYLQLNNDLLAHPFFWASFITIGDVAAVDLARPFVWWHGVLVGLIVLAISLGLWRRHRRIKEIDNTNLTKEKELMSKVQEVEVD